MCRAAAMVRAAYIRIELRGHAVGIVAVDRDVPIKPNCRAPRRRRLARWRFSAADIIIVHTLNGLERSGLLEAYPTLAAYIARAEARQARVRGAIGVVCGERRRLAEEVQ
jgi:hypothetical protein